MKSLETCYFRTLYEVFFLPCISFILFILHTAQYLIIFNFNLLVVFLSIVSMIQSLDSKAVHFFPSLDNIIKIDKTGIIRKMVEVFVVQELIGR